MSNAHEEGLPSTDPEVHVGNTEALQEWDDFVESKSDHTDRELLIEVLWHTKHARKEVQGLRELVERVEAEADQAMKSLTDPATMMSAAQKFLGG